LNGLSDRINYFRLAKQVLHNDNDPVAPPIARPAESVHQTEIADQADSPAEVSTDTDVDLLDAAVNSDEVKEHAKSLPARLLKHSGAGIAWISAMYELHKLGTIIILLIVFAGVAWLVYHNRVRIKGFVVRLLK
jgi:hypothetical protein